MLLVTLPCIDSPSFTRHNNIITTVLQDLETLIWENKPKDVILGTLLVLRNKLLLDFAEQESMMVLTNYPLERVHHRAHDGLIRVLLMFIQAYDEDRIIISEYAIKMLSEGIAEHIEVHDKPLAEYLSKLG